MTGKAADKPVKARALRQSMAWIHGWLGLLAGWILFAMFLTGTASYFRPEITSWMQPEIRPAAVSPERAAETAVAYLQKTFPGDEQWYIYLPDERTPITRVFARAHPDENGQRPRRSELKLDPSTGKPLTARETRGGEHFYRFHFQLQIPHPWGRWLAGLCAMFMLSAIVSGVITHKRIFVDFFTLRWGKGQRSWLDAHNVSAVVALPFHAVITYTGLITLVAMYMPWPVTANYASPAEFNAEAFGRDAEVEAANRPAPLVPIAPLVTSAQRGWDGGQARTVIIRNPGDAAATVTVLQGTDHRLNARGGSITYAGATGEQMSASPPQGPAVATAGVMLGLHLAWFAQPALRWTLFVLGLSGAAMVGTGLLLWTAARRGPISQPFFGLALVERLNIGAIACLPAGMAAFLLANRLIPADLPGRSALEVKAMFWVWFGLAALSLVRPARKAWRETLAVSAAAFAAIPLVNAATTDRGLFASLASGHWLFAGFDIAMLLVAALIGLGAWRASVAEPAVQRKATARPAREPASGTRDAA